MTEILKCLDSPYSRNSPFDASGVNETDRFSIMVQWNVHTENYSCMESIDTIVLQILSKAAKISMSEQYIECFF